MESENMNTLKLSEAPSSVLLATIHNPGLDAHVYVYEDGRVRLESKDNILEVGIKAEHKHEWLKYCYIRDLIRSGVTGQELAEAIGQIEKAERDLQEESCDEALDSDLRYGKERFKNWCFERGIDCDNLTETEAMELINQAIHEWRKGNAKRSV